YEAAGRRAHIHMITSAFSLSTSELSRLQSAVGAVCHKRSDVDAEERRDRAQRCQGRVHAAALDAGELRLLPPEGLGESALGEPRCFADPAHAIPDVGLRCHNLTVIASTAARPALLR